MQPPEDESHLTHVPSKVPWVPRPAEPNLLQPNLLDEDVRWVLWKASYLEQLCWLLVVGCWLWFLLYHTGSYLVAWLLALWFLPGGMVFVEFQRVLSGGWRVESVFLGSTIKLVNNTYRQYSWSYVWFPPIVILLENIPHHFGIWDAYKPVYDSDSGAVCRCRISCINSAVLLFLLILPVSIPYSQKMPRAQSCCSPILNFCTTNCTNYT